MAMRFAPRVEMASRAADHGFYPIDCPSCRGFGARCANCGGSGRLWRDGPATLSDDGLQHLFRVERPAGRFDLRRLMRRHPPAGSGMGSTLN